MNLEQMTNGRTEGSAAVVLETERLTRPRSPRPYRQFLFVLFPLVLLTTSCSRQILPPRESHPLSGDEEVVPFPVGKFGSRLIDVSPVAPKTLNPLNVTDKTSAGIIGLLHAALTSYDPIHEKVIPALAKSWEISPDYKKFTFHLREGLRFSDGHPLTSADVAFTFQCIYDKRYPNRTQDQASINGKPFQITVPDPLTVEIQLPELYAPFLEMLGGIEILPQHVLQNAFDSGELLKIWTSGMAKNSPERFVGAGMFKIFSYQSGQRILLIPNPYFWQVNSEKQRLPYIDLYLIKFVQDINASIVEFASGQCDSIEILPDQVAWVKPNEKKRDFVVYERGPAPKISFLWFNLNSGKNKEGKYFVAPYKIKWFQEIKFRQAISYAIDRKGIVNGVLFGRGSPLWSFYGPANGKWHNPHVPQYPFNLEKSKELLAELGMKLHDNQKLYDSSGRLVEFTLNTNQENQIRQNIATTIKENLKSLGITVNLQFLDFNTFISKIDGSYDYEAGIMGLSGGGDPVGSLSILKSSGKLNFWFAEQKTPFAPWQAEIDRLMDLQLTTMEEPKRIEIVNQIQNILSQELPMIYLVNETFYVGVRNKWQNLQIPKNGSALWNLESLWAH